MAHQWVCDVWEQNVEGVDYGVGFGEYAAHVDVLVHHERVGSDVVALHYPMQHAMEVCKMSI